jgi:hypothetical protein
MSIKKTPKKIKETVLHWYLELKKLKDSEK